MDEGRADAVRVEVLEDGDEVVAGIEAQGGDEELVAGAPTQYWPSAVSKPCR